MSKKVVFDWRGLEDFRKSLPVAGERLNFQHEMYCFGPYAWDIVMAQYLLQQRPHDIVQMNVKDIMDALGLPKVSKPNTLSLVYVSEERVEAPEVDDSKPIIFARTPFYQGQVLPIDGLTRIVRAFRRGQVTIASYILTEEESEACRIR